MHVSEEKKSESARDTDAEAVTTIVLICPFNSRRPDDNVPPGKSSFVVKKATLLTGQSSDPQVLRGSWFSMTARGVLQQVHLQGLCGSSDALRECSEKSISKLQCNQKDPRRPAYLSYEGV